MIPTDDKGAAEATDYVLGCYELTKWSENATKAIINGILIEKISEEIPAVDFL